MLFKKLLKSLQIWKNLGDWQLNIHFADEGKNVSKLATNLQAFRSQVIKTSTKIVESEILAFVPIVSLKSDF